MASGNSRNSAAAHRCRFWDVGLLVSVLAVAGCGTGYREGAAAGMDAGSEAHGEAIVGIAREMSASECAVFGATDRCNELRRELTQELVRCLGAAGCDEALAASAEGEVEEVAGYLAVSGMEAGMKALGEHFRRRR